MGKDIPAKVSYFEDHKWILIKDEGIPGVNRGTQKCQQLDTLKKTQGKTSVPRRDINQGGGDEEQKKKFGPRERN